MRNRDGTTGSDLLLENGHYTAVAAQDVSKSHSKVSRVIVLQTQNDQFGNPLCYSHYIGGVYSFVRGNHDEGLATELPRDKSDIVCTKDVVGHRLETPLFH